MHIPLPGLQGVVGGRHVVVGDGEVVGPVVLVAGVTVVVVGVVRIRVRELTRGEGKLKYSYINLYCKSFIRLLILQLVCLFLCQFGVLSFFR